MKVVFLQDVPNVAKAGEIREVADGYGRNYLIPKKLAVVATPDKLKGAEAQNKAEARRYDRLEKEAEAIAARLKTKTATFKVKAGTTERLYGSITSADIAERVGKIIGHDIDKRKVELADPIRDLGTYQVPIKLTKTVTAEIKVVVEAEAQADPEKAAKPKKAKAEKAPKTAESPEPAAEAEKAEKKPRPKKAKTADKTTSGKE